MACPRNAGYYIFSHFGHLGSNLLTLFSLFVQHASTRCPHPHTTPTTKESKRSTYILAISSTTTSIQTNLSLTLRNRILSEYDDVCCDLSTLMNTSVSEPPPDWVQSGSIENYALTLGKASGQARDMEDDEDVGGVQEYRVVAAAKTTRVEMKE